MHSTHPQFTEPADEATLWRYMPYGAYIEMLRRRALHFTRVDKLRDPYEARWLAPDRFGNLPTAEQTRLRTCRVTGYESHLVTGQSEPAVAAAP